MSFCFLSITKRQQRVDCLERNALQRKRHFRHLGGPVHVRIDCLEAPPAEQRQGEPATPRLPLVRLAVFVARLLGTRAG